MEHFHTGLEMPIFKYFVFVGGFLIAALLVVTPYLPTEVRQSKSGGEPVQINIKSNRKWPEKIVYDTSLPTMRPPPPADVIDEAPSLPLVDTPIYQPNDAMAEVTPTTPAIEKHKAKVAAASKKVRVAKKSLKEKIAQHRPPESDFFFDW
ncbi:hypothetical protein FIU28_25385 [Tardiphaga sp. vice154]|uniref:hypothetical protein n=1 Tax=Tardiphaga sp. vice154 TaxID=2592814 RepID=UPI001163D25E|nr:hypothetical protein [Tardiphaga sp. vice154]QDM24107.1 hypothetical protein FIU28_25385 [Tardiphaga sp. vice154]